MDRNELLKQATDLRNSNHGREAAEVYQQLVALNLEDGDKQAAAEALHMKAVSLKIENDTEAALAAHREARQMYDFIDDPIGVARVDRDMAVAYEYDHQYDKALPLAEASVKALAKHQEADPSPSVTAEYGISLAKQAKIKSLLGNMQTAQAETREAIKLLAQGDNWFYEATARLQLGEIYQRQTEYDLAIAELEAAEQLFIEHASKEPHPRRLTQLYGILANVYMKQEDKEKAVVYHQKALSQLSGSESAVGRVLEDINQLALEAYTDISYDG